MKILIVDDDPGTINSLKIGLISFGHQVVAAKDGNRALKIIASLLDSAGPVELVVTDLKMPCMNGLELIRSAKELSPELPAVLITAYGDDSVRSEIEILRDCAYLDKPFCPERLLKMITEVHQKNEKVNRI